MGCGGGADNSVLDNSDQCITIAIPSSVFQCHKGSSGLSRGTLGFSFYFDVFKSLPLIYPM